MNVCDCPMKATPEDELYKQLLDPCVPKTEREWFAARRLRELVRQCTELQAKCNELEAELSGWRHGSP